MHSQSVINTAPIPVATTTTTPTMKERIVEEDIAQRADPATISTTRLPDSQQLQLDRQTMTTATSTMKNQILTDGKKTLSSALRSYQYVTSGFYKFLARFSGEWDELLKCGVYVAQDPLVNNCTIDWPLNGIRWDWEGMSCFQCIHWSRHLETIIRCVTHRRRPWVGSEEVFKWEIPIVIEGVD